MPKYDEIVRREKMLRLYNLSMSGARLDKKSRALIDEMVSEGKARDIEGDESSSRRGEGGWFGEEEFAPKALVEGSMRDVIAALDSGKVSQEALRELVIRTPVKVACALRRLASQGKWSATSWQGLLWHLASLREGKDQPMRLHGYVAVVIIEAPDELFNEAGSAVAGFVERLAEGCATDWEDDFGVLWTKAWTGKGDGEVQASSTEGPLTEALNHPAGRLAEAAMARLRKYEPQIGAGLPVAVRSYFDLMGKDPRGQLGRVLLATRLHYLFMIDPEWATRHLIAHLSSRQSQESANLWSGYGWSPRLGPDLLRAFKGTFLEFLLNPVSDDRSIGNLRRLFMAVCLETPGELRDEEIRSVVDVLPENGLVTVLGSLEQRFTGEAAQRGKIWCEKVYPWLRDYWPTVGWRNTAGTSEAILEMLVECGDAFPAAAEWSLAHLGPIVGQGLHRLARDDRAALHPAPMLGVLDEVVEENVLALTSRHALREVLDALVNANSELASDPRFQRLYQVATR